MFSFANPSVFQASKCFFTYATMGHLEPEQLPTKKKPWTTVQSLDFIHEIDLILPQECAELVKQKPGAVSAAPQFKRVVMSLGQVLTGDFFKEYIKIGDVLLLSEGRPGQDNVFTLKDGILKMFLDRETYERAGLVGKPHGVKGSRGLKPRWVVELDLKAKSMFPGKKGFDRLIYACKNALNTPVTWQFYNCSKTPDPDPLEKHSPKTITAFPAVLENVNVMQPSLKPDAAIIGSGDRLNAEDFATGVYEWLSLIRLESPRVTDDDQIDPYLSSYQIPGEAEEQQKATVCKVSWQGFFPSTVARQILVDTILALPSKTWFSMSMSTFASSKGVTGDGTECTLLRPPKSPGEFMLWEVKTHE